MCVVILRYHHYHAITLNICHFNKNIRRPFIFKTGKEKQKRGKEKQSRGKEKQSRGKEKQPLNLFFPCLKKKVDGISKLKAGQGRMTKILVNFLWNHGQ